MNSKRSHTPYFENNYVKMWIINGILFKEFISINTVITLEIVQYIINDRLVLSAKQTLPLLLDIRSLNKMSYEARKFMRTKEAFIGIQNCAVITNNRIKSMTANMILTFQKTPVSIQFFTEMNKATNWLKMVH